MTQDISEDLRLLEDAVTKFAAGHAAEAGMAGPAPDFWPELVEMGLVGLALPEDSGGAGFGARGALVAGQALGAQAVPAGFAVDAVYLPALLDAAGAAEWCDRMIAGQARIACHGALLPGSGGEALAFGPDGADVVLLRDGAALRLVPAAELSLTWHRMIDGRPLARLAPALAGGLPLTVPAGEAMARALPVALVAAAAETLGAVERLCELTLDYLHLRKQFGRPLASFQSLQFRMVDIAIAREELRALTHAAAAALDTGAAEGPALAHAAWVQALWSGRQAAEEAVQLHGAIGMTAECAIAPPVKHVAINEQLFGGEQVHLERYRALLAA
ncbi:MAG: acyl-CoA dehydrogenase family protein [Tropicimonas sp.]|uniref:acyl-CoA dehydrogenase family protein n=1 Tax=Tropicimonas sp. TaxID=2067044 RepID=UPI003A84BDB7